MILRATTLFVASIFLAACSGVQKFAEGVNELQAVQKAVMEKVDRDIVGVTLMNGTSLNVNLVNSPLKKLPAAEKQAKAAELAKVAYDSYAGRAAIKAVRVTFAVVSTTLVVVTTNDSSDSFTFDASELAAAQSR